ncbi:MAG: serine/threonine protein kinase, partial [Anaerolineae bacterium]|nr:serine/threonine protein kinase [Anaerolineae bacterium]
MKLIAERYERGELLGQGGMGDVYHGRDTLTGDPVAIKGLKPDIVAANPGLIERFVREGELLRQLDHPNIVKMLTATEDEEQHVLIMEYVSGGSLRDLLERESPLPVRRAVEIALDVADALTRAHRLKIIHRDIKPANVLLAEDGTPRLTDFGVARLSDRTRMTESGIIVGTFAYLSPESCRDEAPDARSDIWAFGVMLYEMLTGQRPFTGTNPLALMAAIVDNPHTEARDLCPIVPSALNTLVQQMLEKDPQQRISSVRKVGSVLEDIMLTLDEEDYPHTRKSMAGGDISRFSTPTNSLAASTPQGKFGTRVRIIRRPESTATNSAKTESSRWVWA